MKTIQVVVSAAALLGVLMNSAVFAGRDDHDDHDSRRGGYGHHRHHQHDHIRPEVVYAPVIYVEPMYQVIERVRPRRECWSSTDSYRSGNDGAGGLVLGGLLGGVIGHNVAHGRDRDAAVLAGTLLGATIGHDMAHNGASAPVTRTHCETVDDYGERTEIIGYRVQYRYFGRIYETHTDRHPGARVRVTVNIDG